MSAMAVNDYRRAGARWLTVVTLVLSAIYVGQIVPHAHAEEQHVTSEPVPAHHSHSPGDHSHNGEGESAPAEKTHHHHAISWHLDLHFLRSHQEGQKTTSESDGAHLCSVMPVGTDLRQSGYHAAFSNMLESLPVPPADSRGPPLTR